MDSDLRLILNPTHVDVPELDLTLRTTHVVLGACSEERHSSCPGVFGKLTCSCECHDDDDEGPGMYEMPTGFQYLQMEKYRNAC